MNPKQNSKFKIQNSKAETDGRPSADPLMQRITQSIRARLPDVTAVVFFGSRVAGASDAFSDYDALVLLPEGLESDQRECVKLELRVAFPKAKLDLVFGSERWLLDNLRVEAYYRFWLENGIATFGHVPKVDRYPTLYKDALDSRLNIIRSEIKVIEAWSPNLRQEASGYLRILKHLILIEHALRGDYSNQSVWTEMDALIGAKLIGVLRDPKAVRRIRRPMVLQVRRTLGSKLAQVKQQVIQSKLPSKYPMRAGARA